MTYQIQTTSKSFCPECSGVADLLMDSDPDALTYNLAEFEELKIIAFYICWTCRYIGQVGVGPIERISEDG